MRETFPIDLDTAFHSINGGISMWIPRLADFLAEFGVGRLLEDLRIQVSQHTAGSMQNDCHFLMLGIDSIDRRALDNAIAPLKKSRQKMLDFSKEHEELKESLRDMQCQWLALSEKVKQYLALWVPWASRTEMARRQELLPWVVDPRLMELTLRLDLSMIGSVFESPRELAHNIDYFNTKIEAIDRVISQAHRAGSLPNDLSVADFHGAIAELRKKQEEFNKITGQMTEIMRQWQLADGEYFAKRDNLLQLLWTMSADAQWSLFRICHAQLGARIVHVDGDNSDQLHAA